MVGGLVWWRSSVWRGQAVVVAKSAFGGVREFPVAPTNRAGESRRRQAFPAVLATVVWCSSQGAAADYRRLGLCGYLPVITVMLYGYVLV